MRCSNSLFNIHFPREIISTNCSFESVFYLNVSQSTSRKAYIGQNCELCIAVPCNRYLHLNHLLVIQKNNKINFCYSESITEANVVKCSENGQTTDDPFQILAQISYRFATFNKVHRLGGHTIKWSMDSGERFSSEE